MLIRSWFELNTSCSHKQKKSSMISTKVTPTVKATSVNVSSDERNNNLTMTFEPLRSASLSLSIELAKDMPSISIRQHKPDTLSVYTNHCFKRIAKAAPATFSTSVSANGTMGHQDDGSAAMESLAKSIIQLDNESSTHQESQQVTKNETRTLVSPTCQSTSFWTWLGLPSAEEPQEEKELVEDMAASAPIPIKSTSHTVTSTASSSWSSFLFAANVDKVQVCTNPEEPSTPKPLYIQKALQEEQNNIRKVKSLSSCPIPNTKLAPSHTSTLRPSVSSSSLQSQKPGKITNNKVLPLFASQCQVQSLPEKDTFFTKAFDTIQSIMQPPETTTSWIAKKMKAKFSHFVQDLKQPQPILMDKRIVVVGVHGWFPMKLVRSMIGEPTGTSIKFCEQMALAVRTYFETEHKVMLPLDAITCVPLEGEGKIEDRVNQLYTKLIENSVWLEAVSSADVILWATHSQGTPVSIMLLQRLLERGHVQLIRQSVCMLAMAGISHGPFPALKKSLIVKYFEADAARELFEFMDSSSSISTKFRQSLEYILTCGIKLVLTGSMQDQVVPLYSAILHAVDHPNILRSIYIDGHIFSEDDFLINLIVFCFKLRNTGLSDHDLIIHLSQVLAGSLYALEGGHSTVYEELQVYLTAVQYMFETAPFGPCVRQQDRMQYKMDPFQAKLQPNPYYLPWALHSMFTDPMILANEGLKADLKHLLFLFDQWQPTSTRLRELKFRLEPLLTLHL